jgi:hypothetical protein
VSLTITSSSEVTIYFCRVFPVSIIYWQMLDKLLEMLDVAGLKYFIGKIPDLLDFMR